MKKHIRKFAAFFAAVSMCTAMATQMPMSASAATTYTYNDQWSTIQYQLTTINNQNRALITKVTSKNQTNSSGNIFIYIPTTLSGRPVSIGSRAFQYMNNAFEVSATDIREIQSNAFDCCGGLKEFFISQKCTSIASDAFYCCNNLKKAIFQGSQYAVNDNSSLTIETNAFHNCSHLNTISFGCRDDIIIKKTAFSGCHELKNFTKDNASYDHSSLYVQKEAFKNCGLQGNSSNSLVSASAVQSNIGWSHSSWGDRLTGKVIAIDLITQTPDTSYYYSAEPTYSAANNSRKLEKEAAKYGVNLQITNLCAHVDTTLTTAQIDATGSFIDRPEVLSGLKQQFSFLSSCTNMDQATAKLKAQYGASEIAYVVDINADRRSYAWCGGNHEYAVVYQRYSYGMNHDTVWMHEVAHTFGTRDIYNGNDLNYINTYLKDDLMNVNLDNVSWFTASMLGWTDSALKTDAVAVIGSSISNSVYNSANGGSLKAASTKPVRVYEPKKK